MPGRHSGPGQGHPGPHHQELDLIEALLGAFHSPRENAEKQYKHDDNVSLWMTVVMDLYRRSETPGDV